MKKLTIFAGTSAMILAAAAYAMPGDGKLKMDVNGNGTVTKAEATTVANARFAKMDADGNGSIDAADKAARVKARFAKMDTDGNGAVTEAEFMAADAARMQDRLQHKAAMGERGDGGRGGHRGGRHGRGGHMGSVGNWGQADIDGDKAISRTEYDKATQARFAAKDKDNNGEISNAEMQSARQEMRAKWRSNKTATPADAG
jgi:hypothetical protein